MNSSKLRKRIHHGDTDSLNEPLLGNRDFDEHNLDDERNKEHMHWTLVFSNIIAKWAQWLANVVLGSGSLIGRMLPFLSNTKNGANNVLPPNPLQEARLKYLKQRLAVPFDGALAEHQVEDD